MFEGLSPWMRCMKPNISATLLRWVHVICISTREVKTAKFITVLIKQKRRNQPVFKCSFYSFISLHVSLTWFVSDHVNQLNYLVFIAETNKFSSKKKTPNVCLFQLFKCMDVLPSLSYIIKLIIFGWLWALGNYNIIFHYFLIAKISCMLRLL